MVTHQIRSTWCTKVPRRHNMVVYVAHRNIRYGNAKQCLMRLHATCEKTCPRHLLHYANMCMCICVFVYLCMCMCMSMLMRVCMRMCMCMRLRPHMCVHVYVYVHVYLCVGVRVRVGVGLRVCLCVGVCIWVYVYVLGGPRKRWESFRIVSIGHTPAQHTPAQRKRNGNVDGNVTGRKR